MMPQDDILKVILTTLHRLETRLNEQNSRLSTIEFLVLSKNDGSFNMNTNSGLSSISSDGCYSKGMSQPLSQELYTQDHPAAAAYQASMDKLRTRFEVDSRSELALEDVEEPDAPYDSSGRNNQQTLEIIDNYSVSVYPSRPVSGFGFYKSGAIEAPEVQALRYEYTRPPPEESISERSDSSPKRSFSESQCSSSTAPTSVPPTSPSSSLRDSATRGTPFSKFRGSLKRANLTRSKEKKTFTPVNTQVQIVAENVGKAGLKSTTTLATVLVKRRYSTRFLERGQKGAKACAFFVPRVVCRISRSMMDQQLKKLDIVTY
jgi:hypothetical protein